MQCEEEHKVDMGEVMGDRELGELWREFLRENGKANELSFWLEVETFRSLVDAPSRRHQALDIYEKYLAPDCFFPVRLPRSPDFVSAVRSPEPTSFDEAQLSVRSLLEDDFLSFFFCSPLYLAYRDQRTEGERAEWVERVRRERRGAMYTKDRMFSLEAFGSPLDAILDQQALSPAGRNFSTPFVLFRTIDFLLDLSLHRSLTVCTLPCLEFEESIALRDHFLDGQDFVIGRSKWTLEGVVAVFRMWMRELPHALIPSEALDRVVTSPSFSSNPDRLSLLSSLLSFVPPRHLPSLEAIMFYSHQLYHNRAVNDFEMVKWVKVLTTSIITKRDPDRGATAEYYRNCCLLTQQMIIMADQLFSFQSIFGSKSLIPKKYLVAHKRSVHALAPGPRGSMWSADSSGVVCLWDLSSSSLLLTRKYSASIYYVRSMLWPSGGGGEEGVWSLWVCGLEDNFLLNVQSGEAFFRLPFQLFSVSFPSLPDDSPSSRHVICSGVQAIHVLKLSCEREEIKLVSSRTVTVEVAGQHFFSCVEVSGENVFLSSSSGHLFVLSLSEVMEEGVTKVKPRGEIHAHSSTINKMLILGGRIWLCSNDSSISVWSTSGLRELSRMRGHKSKVLNMEAVDSFVISCCWDSSILVWDSRTFGLVKAMPSLHHDGVSQVVVVKEGKEMWTASYDRSIVVASLDSSHWSSKPSSRIHLGSSRLPPSGVDVTRSHSSSSSSSSLPSSMSSIGLSSSSISSSISSSSLGASVPGVWMASVPSSEERKTQEISQIIKGYQRVRTREEGERERVRETLLTEEEILEYLKDIPDQLIVNFSELSIDLSNPLAEGTTSTIFLASWRSNPVAVKQIQPEVTKKAIRHYAMLLRLHIQMQHPNLVLIMGVSIAKNSLWIIMEYMEKGSLREVMKSREKPCLSTRLAIAKTIVETMVWLHSFRPPIVHEDLSSSSVLMDGVGRVKLGFLGQAHLKRAVQMVERVGEDLLHIAPELLLPSFPSSPPPPPSSSPSSSSSSVLSSSPSSSSSSISPRPQQSPRPSSPSLASSSSSSSTQMGEEESEGKETEKADVYSFGWMMEEMWRGGEGKREWRGEGGREVRTWGEVMERVARGGERPVERKEWPRSLASLITSCWSPSPSLRPSFPDILRQIDTIVADCLISDPSGRHLWTRYYLGKDKVVWEKLGSAMISQLALKMTTKDVAMRCVKSILDEKDTGSVSINDFNDFLQWFGPLTRNTFSEVHALLKEPWFHGFIAVGQAENRVSRAKPGSFLVRFSSSSPGSFALTVLLDKSNIRHYRIDKRRNQFFLGKSSFSSLHELIRKHKSSLCLKTPCPGSPYYFLFNEVETTGYQIVFH